MKKRKYFTTILLDKAYRGEKSINLIVDKSQAVKMAKAILEASESGEKFDLTVYDYRKREDGRIQMTITQAIKP